MKMKLSFLIICSAINFIFPNPKSSIQKLPTQDEVLATGHPLIMDLYVSLIKYGKNPVVPKVVTFSECLKKHILLSSPWIHEKGFSKSLEEAHKLDKSEKDITAVIENNANYKKVPDMAQTLLTINLMQAFKDCSCYKTSK